MEGGGGGGRALLDPWGLERWLSFFVFFVFLLLFVIYNNPLYKWCRFSFCLFVLRCAQNGNRGFFFFFFNGVICREAIFIL